MTGVRHVDLSVGPPGDAVPEPGTLVVFWLNDRPVGEVLAADNEGLSALASHAVRDATLVTARAAAAAEGAAAPPGGPLSASVVVCTRDRPDELSRCLASLPSQSMRPVQIVVVDNASRTARTRDVALDAGVDYVREDRPGLDFARNTGALAATGDIVCYTDDDVVLHPRWLERMVTAFDTPDVMAVTGLVLPAELVTEAQRHFEKHWGFGRGYDRIDFGASFFASDRVGGCPSWEIGAGASMAFRRSAFDRVGLFDERLDVGAAGCSGDSEYWHKVLSAGYVCRYEPSAVAYHFHRREMTGLESQIFHYMRGHAAALLIQYERTGHRGNLKRALITMPRLYARRLASRTLHGPSEKDRLLSQEIRGYFAGLAYYVVRKRPAARRDA